MATRQEEIAHHEAAHAIVARLLNVGLTAALNRPGGNVTGVTVAKRLELLREVAPSIGAIGILLNPTNPNAQSDVRDVQDVARMLGLRTHVGNIRSENEIEVAFEELRHERVGAFILLPDPNFLSRRNQNRCAGCAPFVSGHVLRTRVRRCGRLDDVFGQPHGGISLGRRIRQPYPQWGQTLPTSR